MLLRQEKASKTISRQTADVHTDVNKPLIQCFALTEQEDLKKQNKKAESQDLILTFFLF